MLNNLNFRVKLAIPVALVTVIFAIIFTYTLMAFNQQVEFNNQYTQDVQPVLMDLDDGYRDVYQATAALQGLVIANGNKTLIEKQVFEYNDNAPKARKRLLSSQRLIDMGFLDRAQQSHLDELAKNFDTWLAMTKPYIATPEQAPALFEQQGVELEQAFDKMRASLKQVQDALLEQVEKTEQEKLDAISSAKMVMEAGGISALIAAIVLTWFLGKILIAPVLRLTSAMKNIASGEGDLTARVPVETQDEIGQLAESFNTFVEKIQQTITEVIISSNAVRAEMTNIQSITQGVAQGASNQQFESDAVATAVHELSATSETVSQNAEDAAHASQDADNEATSAKRIISTTVVSIQSLSNELQQAAQVINTLEHDVGNIASILDVIRGIADQTNLLALNAAIEAARAGEQGRGFAVVADEVRSLASKTQASTGEIQNMIEKLQNGAKQAVSVMTSSQESGQQTATQASEAGASLDTIVNAIAMINDINIQIATAAKEQNHVSEEVSSNVQRIADNSHQVVEMVASAENACESLAQQCESLDQLVAQFKV
ncbi:methyl-accepting chemotaxis protein [Motilimonas sp. KMU-193]|uniref:methyl-accepting chemotaxis protein n=1 Tax=Motilimonas sp. KMU-193 TaxID=3388668 RepID=UPI00396AFE25